MGRHKNSTRSGPAESLADQRERILDLNQDEMARRLDVSQATVSLVERSRATPANLKAWVREYRISAKRFKALSEEQDVLPLWKFAQPDIAGETETRSTCPKSKTV